MLGGFARGAAFVAQSKAFKAYYGGMVAFFNNSEKRILFLYQKLKLGIMPWMWDYANYERDPEMKGYFYPEDIINIEQIDEYERKK